MQHPPGDDFTDVGKEPGVHLARSYNKHTIKKPSIYEFLKNDKYAWKFNLDDIDTRDVPEGLGDTLVLVIDDKGAQLLHMAPVRQLTLPGAAGVDFSLRKTFRIWKPHL